MVHFFALLFWVAGALAFVAGLPQLGIAIFVVIVFNGVFAFAQEERAQHAAEGLRQMLPRRATVLRDGVPQQIAADELVVGDVVCSRKVTEYRRMRRWTASRVLRSTPRRLPVRAFPNIRVSAMLCSLDALSWRAKVVRT